MNNAVENKENATDAVIPFNPNFDDDQAVPSFDIAQLINDVAVENGTTNSVTVATATNTTSNVSNNIPCTCFANCSIGNITFNIQK